VLDWHNLIEAWSTEFLYNKLKTHEDRCGGLEILLVYVERTVEAILEVKHRPAFRMKHCYSAHGRGGAYQASR